MSTMETGSNVTLEISRGVERARHLALVPQQTENNNYPMFEVPGLSEAVVVHQTYRQLLHDRAPRHRQTVHAALSGTEHSLRITQPERGQVKRGQEIGSIVLLHGFLEMIDCGTGKNLHDALAPLYPDKRIVSIATDGVGRYCKRVGFKEGLNKDFKQMAISRHRLIQGIAGTDPVSVFDVSMGSIISLNMLDFDSTLPDYPEQAESEDTIIDHKLGIEAVVHHSHAQLASNRVIPDVIVKFPLHMTADLIRMRRFWLSQAVGFGQVMLASTRSMAALVGNSKNIMKGSNIDTERKIAQLYKTGYISGRSDPLGQHATHLQLATEFPGTVSVNISAKSGHAACLDSRTVAAELATKRAELLLK